MGGAKPPQRRSLRGTKYTLLLWHISVTLTLLEKCRFFHFQNAVFFLDDLTQSPFFHIHSKKRHFISRPQYYTYMNFRTMTCPTIISSLCNSIMIISCEAKIFFELESQSIILDFFTWLLMSLRFTEQKNAESFCQQTKYLWSGNDL